MDGRPRSRITAAETGASVVVLENGPRAGGTRYVSGGIVWTVDSVEQARERVPKGSALLHRLVVDRLPAALDWLANHGIQLHEPTFKLPGPGKAFNPVAATDQLVSELESLGGRLLLESSLEDVRTSPGGSVRAARYRANGTTNTISTQSVVLATGGFQGNEQLVQQYITDAAGHAALRANPWSTGDGFTIAASLGETHTWYRDVLWPFFTGPTSEFHADGVPGRHAVLWAMGGRA